MGRGYGYKCPKCKYKFSVNIGAGFMFPMAYQKTISEVKKGHYGELGKNLFEMHPDGAMDIEEGVFRCESCGRYMSLPRLAMFIPKGDYQHETPKGDWSIAMPWHNTDYISSFEIKEHYDYVGEYDHKCECGGNMVFIPESIFFKENPECPKCKSKMECDMVERWD